MKIKLSQKQWQDIGKKAGWLKTAGDSFVNPKYTNEVAEVLKGLGDVIISQNSYEIVFKHKVMGGKNITLKMRIFEEEYEHFYEGTVYAGDMQIGLLSGETANLLVSNLNSHLRMILDEIDHQQFLKEV